jgi:hypothetical protein
MTVAQLTERVLTRAGEISGAGSFHTPSQALYALNVAQWLFVLMTLCLETTGTLSLTAAQPWYLPLSTFPDFLFPLRVRVAGTGGLKLGPGRLAEFDARNPGWQDEPGTPQRYAVLGCNLMAIRPQPAGSGVSLTVTYARGCTRLTSDGQTPDVAEEDQPALIDFAVCFLRAKEGAQELAKTKTELDRFFAAVKKRADYVRARNREQQYDRVPPEFNLQDVSRLLKGSK